MCDDMALRWMLVCPDGGRGDIRNAVNPERVMYHSEVYIHIAHRSYATLYASKREAEERIERLGPQSGDWRPMLVRRYALLKKPGPHGDLWMTADGEGSYSYDDARVFPDPAAAFEAAGVDWEWRLVAAEPKRH